MCALTERRIAGEYKVYLLAKRSFLKEVCLIQNRFKEEEFLTIVKKSIKYQHNKRRKEEKDLLESDLLPQVNVYDSC